MFDFSKSFEDYVSDWLALHRACKCEYDGEERTDIVVDLYKKWRDAPLEELNGLSPREFFKAMQPQELIEEYTTSYEIDFGPAPIMEDVIIDNPACAPLLRDIVRNSKDDELRIASARLLTKMEVEQPLDVYLALLCDEDADGELRDLAVDLLSDYADEVAEELYKMIPNADTFQRELIAEVLINAKHDDRTFKLLRELYAEEGNILYVASLFGKYGDERAIPILYNSLATCDFVEFSELRNSIERLGGEVDFIRDFSEDPTYIAYNEKQELKWPVKS